MAGAPTALKRTITLPSVEGYIDGLSQKDGAKVSADITALAKGLYAAITTKPLRGPIRELIVKKHRVVYFVVGSTLYLVDAFRKQSQKTPSRIIDQAETICRDISKHQKS